MTLLYFTDQLGITEPLLRLIAFVPTSALATLADANFWLRLEDRHVMRIAVYLAQKSFDEGGCPIGGVVLDNATRRIVGKGHNTLIQDNDPYNHGETSAMRDAGSIDFSQTTIFTTLTPCRICTALLAERGVARVVIGNTPSADNNEQVLRERGVRVEQLFDSVGIELYERFQALRPELDKADWRGIAALDAAERSLLSKSTSSNRGVISPGSAR